MKGEEGMQNQIPSSNQVQNHTRVNNTIIGIFEKKILLWLAARTPAWVLPDSLTLLGLIASVVIFACYALTTFDRRFLWLASLGFVLQWYGDSMDGTLARFRKIERPRFGFFVDHIIDSISEVMIFIGLGLSPFLRFDLALIALVCYLLATIYVYLTTYVNGVFRISYGGIGPTEMRLIAIGANTVVFFTGNPILIFSAGTFSLFDLIIIGVSIILLSLFIYNTIITAMTLSREDRNQQHIRITQERAARRQALNDQRAIRKAAAQAARQSRMRVQID
jgi:archaetidylinositol phosphate synthase